MTRRRTRVLVLGSEETHARVVPEMKTLGFEVFREEGAIGEGPERNAYDLVIAPGPAARRGTGRSAPAESDESTSGAEGPPVLWLTDDPPGATFRGRAWGAWADEDLASAVLQTLFASWRQKGEDLAATQSLYQTMFQVAGEGIALNDSEGRFEAVNPMACKILGRSEEELLGLHPSDVVEAPQDERAVKDSMEAMQPGVVLETRRILRRAGLPDAHLEVNAVKRPDGGFVAFFRDVTAAEADRVELRHSKARLEQAERIAGVGNWYLDLPTGEVVWSDQVYRLFGVTRESFRPTHDGVLERIPAEDRPEVLNSFETALETGQPYAGEHRIQLPDGTTRTVDGRGEVIWSEDGEAIGIRGTVLDISERKLVDEELRQSKERLEEAERIAGLGNWYWDIPSGEVLWSDQVYRIFGVSRGVFEPTYEGFLDKVHPDDRNLVEKAVGGALESGGSYVAEHRIRHPEGFYRLVEERGELVLGEDGEPVGMRGTVYDITERRRMEELQESLHRSETMAAMGRLISGVAHEVRNPLFGLSASLDAMDAEFGTDERLTPFLEVFRDQISRLSRLMKELLQLGKPTTEKLVRSPAVLLAKEAARLCESSLAPFDFRIQEDGASDAIVVVDQDRFSQALINLLENAAQHSEEGAEIVLRIHRSDNDGDASWVGFEVSDFGPGLPKGDSGRLFEPFYSRRKGGTGLGLSIVDHIVRSHDGEVRATNRRSPGDPGTPGGAVFEIRLPDLGSRL